MPLTTYETGLVEVSEYKDGIIIKKNSHDTEGMRWEYDYTDGEMTQEIRYSPDGTTDTTRYKNGIKTFYSYVFTDGTYELKHFNENGLVTYVEGYSTVYKEGHKTTFTIGSNGLYTYSIYEHTDGYVEEVFYDAQANKRHHGRAYIQTEACIREFLVPTALTLSSKCIIIKHKNRPMSFSHRSVYF